MLKINPYIKYLYLDTNYITDKDFETIIHEGLLNNRNLKYLSLKSNKITLNSIKKLSDSIKRDKKKLLEQYLKNIKKPKRDLNFFLQGKKGSNSNILARDYKFLEAIEPELTEKGILNSVKTNGYIKLNTVLKFNGTILPKNK